MLSPKERIDTSFPVISTARIDVSFCLTERLFSML